MHWTVWLPVSYTAGWTTATLFLLVYQLATFNICSPFLTQPYVWSPAHRDVITWPPCCEIATSFRLSSASSTSCEPVYDCSSLSVRRRTILLGWSHHPVFCCKCQSRSEISWVDDRRSAMHARCHHLETALFATSARVRGTSCRHTSV